MKKIWLIFRNEFIAVVSRKSFILTLVLLPMVSFLVLLIVSGLQKTSGADAGSMIGEIFMPSVKTTTEGFVDHSGLVNAIPEGYEYRLKSFENENEAQKALAEGSISAYYIIDQDYINNGKIIYIRPDFNPLGGTIQSANVETLMAYNLTGGDMDLYYRVQNPINVTTHTINTTAPEKDANNPLTYILPYIVTFLFYIVILTSSSLLLNSITNEKQNRVMELLMTSVTPRQLLTGKIIALGLAGLLQTIVWTGSGLLLLQFSGKNFAFASAFQLPISFLIWGILFFLFGYTVYASLMAGVGAMVPSLREGSQLTTVIIMPLIVPLIFISSLITTPDSSLSVFLSLFPLTSPVAMMTRLAATEVHFWQIGLALILLALTAVLLVRSIAGLFQAKNLLSGKSPKLHEFIRALAGKR